MSCLARVVHLFLSLFPISPVDAHLVLLSASHLGLDLLDLFYSRHVGLLNSIAIRW